MSTDLDQQSLPRNPGGTRREALLAVSVVLADVVVSILSNKLTGSSRGVAIALVVFISILAALTFLTVRGFPVKAPATSWRSIVAAEGRPLGGLLILTVIAIIVVFFVTPQRGSTSSASSCQFSAGEAGVLQPSPETAGSLRFCPVKINDGHLPIDGKFRVEGAVLGPVSQRKHLLLAVAPDPETCDALGKPGSGNPFVLSKVSFDSSDGTWSYVDDLGGFPQGVTLGRIYELVSGTDAALQSMKLDHDAWNKSGKSPNLYPGIEKFPQGARVAAKFEVPGGEYQGKVAACSP